jgi:1-deoxy-D-xylulose-5-phosphate synthase
MLAAGLAMGGAHPVVALYATFANRAFDQALCDVALHRLPVTFVLDRAGVTGPDGPSHHGLWDLDLFGLIPGMSVAAPRDAVQLRQLLLEAVERPGPTMIRFPKSTVGRALPPVERWADLDVLRAPRAADGLLIAVGATAAATLEAAELLAVDGIECTVVDPRWVLPIAPALSALAARHRSVFTVEDGVRQGGVGTSLTQTLADAGLATPIRCLGLPKEFLAHGERGAILHEHGLDASGIARTVAETIGARRRPVLRVVEGGARPVGQRRAPSRPSRRRRLAAALSRGRSPA